MGKWDDDEHDGEVASGSKKGKKGRKAPFGVGTGKPSASPSTDTEDGDEDDAEPLPSAQ